MSSSVWAKKSMLSAYTNMYVKFLWLKVEPSQIENHSYRSEFKKKTFLIIAWVCIIKNNIENSGGGGEIFPCLISLSIGISSNYLPLLTTLAFISLCNCLSIFTNIGGHPVFPPIVQSASLLTVLKTFIESTKTWYSGTCCSIYFT